MAITVTYRSLFSIDVWHHFFLDKGLENFESFSAEQKVRQLANYNVQDFFEIQPTATCLQNLRNHQLIFRATKQGIIIGTKIDPDANRPIVDIPADLVFTFLIKLKNQEFYNFTSLPLAVNNNSIYYFSNLSQSDAPILNLSQTSDTFTPGATYQAGTMVQSANGKELFVLQANTANASNADLVQDLPASAFDVNQDYTKGDIVLVRIGDTDQLFESKIDDPNDSPADAPGNDWAKLRDLPLRYANGNDRLSIFKAIHNYALSADTINATAELSAVGTNGLSLLQSDAITGTLNYQLDWRSIPSGFYQLEVTNDDLAANNPAKVISSEQFYLNNGAFFESPFAILELYARRSDDNSFALLAADGSFQNADNTFMLRFKNRLTHWRYIFNVGQSVDGNDDVSVEGSDDKILVTNTIQPLTKSGLVSINHGDQPLPNPSPKMVKPETNSIFSEIYIHH